MESICNDNDNYMDRTVALLVKLYESCAMKEGQNDDYVMAVGIAVRILSG